VLPTAQRGSCSFGARASWLRIALDLDEMQADLAMRRMEATSAWPMMPANLAVHHCAARPGSERHYGDSTFRSKLRRDECGRSML
jgi:hypothetical protein